MRADKNHKTAVEKCQQNVIIVSCKLANVNENVHLKQDCVQRSRIMLLGAAPTCMFPYSRSLLSS